MNEKNDDDDDDAGADADATRSVRSVSSSIHPSIHRLASDTPIRFFFETRGGWIATTDEWSVIFTLFAHRMRLLFIAYERLTNRAPRFRRHRLKTRAMTKTRAARGPVAVSANADRPVWYPGKAPAAHLDGSLPGDYGFDPLSLSADPEMKKWMVQAELQHARWAMLGVAGIVAPELLTKIGMADLPNWIDAATYEYWAPGGTLFFIQMAMFNWAEIRRWQDMKNPGSVNTDPLFGYNANDTNTDVGYPKGLFDKFGWAKDEKTTAELKLKEIKNGRLAMVAFLGCCAQAVTTGTGPVDNLFSHMANPGAIGVFTSQGL